MRVVAVTEAAVISVEVAIMEDSPELAITHQVEFRIMEDLHTIVIVERIAQELTEGMEVDTVGIITEGMRQEGPYSELF